MSAIRPTASPRGVTGAGAGAEATMVLTQMAMGEEEVVVVVELAAIEEDEGLTRMTKTMLRRANFAH